ncbi:MAG: M56 family metallopeptidase, partial [Fuerstia sp.]|nr:M56 family metallopeptidase [Fuerstiella sp.]
MNEHAFRLLIIQAWQITALATVVAVVVKVAAKNRPHLAHALWVLVLIKCVTPPLWGHSLGVFSQLQARLVPNESAALPDVIDPPASVPVAIVETLMSAPEIDVPDSEHGQLETYEPDDLFPMADTESPLDASFVWDGGTDIERSESQSLSIEGDASGLPPEEFEANIANAGPALPIERVESDASWLRPGWLLPSGLVAGAIVTLFIMVFRCLRCLRLIHRHRTTEFDDQLHARIQHLSGQLRIRRIPQIIVSDVLFGPAVLGLLRHTIILPRCLLTSVETLMDAESGKRKAESRDAEQHTTTACNSPLSAVGFPLSFLDPILAHELLHIRRGDLRTGTLQAIVQSLWWFHPAVWLSNRWLSREAERCCDEQVIAELGCSPAQYARSLLSVIECKHQLQPIPVFPGMKPVEITSQRMERIMSLKNGLKKRTPLWCWVMFIALAFLVLPGAVATSTPDENPPVTTTSSDDTESIEAIVVPRIEAGVSRKTYDVSDLLTRLADEQGIPIADANRQLLRVLEASVWGLYEFSYEPSADP